MLPLSCDNLQNRPVLQKVLQNVGPEGQPAAHNWYEESTSEARVYHVELLRVKELFPLDVVSSQRLGLQSP
jgi:hypothetical protein